jgi:hypothetical protein
MVARHEMPGRTKRAETVPEEGLIRCQYKEGHVSRRVPNRGDLIHFANIEFLIKGCYLCSHLLRQFT